MNQESGMRERLALAERGASRYGHGMPHSSKTLGRALIALLFASALGAPAAYCATPLAVTNQTPLTRLIGIPVARSPRAGEVGRFAALADWSSHATVSSRADEAIALDGESLVVTAQGTLSRGAWQFGLALPWVHQYGGVLDGWIDEYHELLGFPEGDRPILGQDELLYRLRQGDRLLLNRDRGSNGPGDVRIAAQRTLIDRQDFAFAVHTQLKLPTGDSDELLGSGGVDLAVGASLERPLALLGRQAALYGGLGVVVGERGEVLPELRERVLGYGHVGIAWPWSAALSLNAQFDAHSSPYDSTLTELGNALQFSVGLDWRFTLGWALSFALNEDISVHSSPDVTFQFGLRRTE